MFSQTVVVDACSSANCQDVSSHHGRIGDRGDTERGRLIEVKMKATANGCASNCNKVANDVL